MFRRFISYYKPHKFMLFLDMLASFMISIIGLFYPIITRNMMNDWIPNADTKLNLVIIFGCVLIGIYAIRALLRYFVQYYGHIIGVKMQAAMRTDLFNKLQKLPYKYYDDHETGKIMSRMTNDLQQVSELAHHGPENIFISGAMLIGSFIYLCTINFRLTMIIFCCAPVLIVVSIIMRKRMRDAFMESRKSIAVINAALESSITGVRVTKAFTNSDKELEKFEKGNEMYVDARKKSYKAMGQFGSSTAFVTDFFNCVIFIAGGIFIASTDPAMHITAGDYMAFIVSIGLFISPINMLIGFVEQLQEGATGFKRFVEIMDEDEELDPVDAKELVVTNGEIEFKNVNFSYNEEKQILFNINLHINPGKKLALVGPSGGGKTTICHLIPRFYFLQNGHIYIDNIDIGDYTLNSLRSKIGIVQQDVFLFGGTIKDNIVYGRPTATEEEIMEAARRANILDFIQSLPNGWNTEIGERGVRLSGGQKQRLAIARLFLKNPPILILDEATSALDNTTEMLIQQSLRELAKGRTCLIVAHRLSTIKNADEIAVISRGKIMEMGDHETLIKQNGIYAEL